MAPRVCLFALLCALLHACKGAHKAHRPLNDAECICEALTRPSPADKAETARWMVHSLDYGVLSTLSTRFSSQPVPFGNVYSFVDGPCNNSTGVPYFYGTFMDQSFQDFAVHPVASFTLSEASMCSQSVKACSVVHTGDPESPLCARLTLTGKLEILDKASSDYEWAQPAFYERHPQVKDWPTDHNWIIARLVIQDIWLVDYFGGAANLSIQEYMSVDMDELGSESAIDRPALRH
jgi:Pyridoxamine 5'-phosphate oxidase